MKNERETELVSLRSSHNFPGMALCDVTMSVCGDYSYETRQLFEIHFQI